MGTPHRVFIFAVFTFILTVAFVGCGGGSSGGNPTAIISGTVAGTEIIAVDDNGTIVASDDTDNKIADVDENYAFTLTGIPVDTNIRVYLITDSGVYPLYVGASSTNVFSLSAAVTIDLGFVDTTAVPGQATPENDPTALAEVTAQAENTATLILVTDETTGAPLSGATVIVDHASDPRQVDRTTAGSASFTLPSGGPITVTIGMSGYEILTLVDYNLILLKIGLQPTGYSAFIQGTVLNYTTGAFGFVTVGRDGFNNFCPSCENLSVGPPDGTFGFYRSEVSIPNTVFNMSAFEYGGVDGTPPTNFTAVTGVSSPANGDTQVVNMAFPGTVPDTMTTDGTITVPASLGAVNFVTATGLRDVVGIPGELVVGFSALGKTSPYIYSLVTFDFTEAGLSTIVMGQAEGVSGGWTRSFNRGVAFGGSAVDFNLIDIPTALSPTGTCGSVAPALSWTGVAGASLYLVMLNDLDTNWAVVMDGGSTSFTLPDLSETPLADLGFSIDVPVNWNVEAMVIPGFNFSTSTLDKDAITSIFTDSSVSPGVSCIP